MKKKLHYIFLSLFFTIYFNHFSIAQNALDFDGIDDFIQTNFQGIQGTSPRTVEAWIKTTANSIPTNGGHQQIITDWGTFVTGGRFTFNVLWGNAIRLEVGGNGVSGTIPVTDGVWHHVAATFDPGQTDQIRLFVDGQLDTFGTTTVALNTQPSIDMRIGQRVDGINFFEGQIDEVRVWDVALSQADIVANMSTEFCEVPNNLVAYYSFNQGIANGDNSSENILMDITTNNNHGNLNGFGLNGMSSNWIDGAELLSGNVDLNEVAEICDSTFTWAVDGISYSTSGNYSLTTNNPMGCDTTFNLDLTLINIDTSVTINGDMLTANATGTIYQWLDCDNNFLIIPDENSQTFSPTQSGNYAVGLQQGSCIIMSSCHPINIVGVQSLDLANAIKLFPNPVEDLFFVEKEKNDWLNYEIIDMNGRRLKNGILSDLITAINLSDLNSGMFFIKVINPRTQDFIFKKVVKKD